jgi:hypothetical protein
MTYIYSICELGNVENKEIFCDCGNSFSALQDAKKHVIKNSILHGNKKDYDAWFETHFGNDIISFFERPGLVYFSIFDKGATLTAKAVYKRRLK